jgi:hypothetical protein
MSPAVVLITATSFVLALLLPCPFWQEDNSVIANPNAQANVNVLTGFRLFHETTAKSRQEFRPGLLLATKQIAAGT